MLLFLIQYFYSPWRSWKVFPYLRQELNLFSVHLTGVHQAAYLTLNLIPPPPSRLSLLWPAWDASVECPLCKRKSDSTTHLLNPGTASPTSSSVICPLNSSPPTPALTWLLSAPWICQFFSCLEQRLGSFANIRSPGDIPSNYIPFVRDWLRNGPA